MRFVTHSHRFAAAIIAEDPALQARYEEFTGALAAITDEDLIDDFLRRKAAHALRRTAFKSLTPSINGLLKDRMLALPGWQAEVDIFNDPAAVGSTEWRLDFACDGAFCVEVAFNHGEAIAWNLLKPVLSCELNHVRKAVQGKLGIYVCATDAMKTAANIDSASGSYEKVLRYLPPMMNQLTVPMMIIGLEPFDSFKISSRAEVVRRLMVLDGSWVGRQVLLTRDDHSQCRGTVTGFVPAAASATGMPQIAVQLSRGRTEIFDQKDIRFLEPLAP